MKFITDLTQFFKDAWEELGKVTWLSRAQVVASTSFVIILVVIFAVYVGFLDFVVTKLFSLII